MAKKWIAGYAWTAGILDGEGTITIYPRKRSDRKCRNPGYSMVVRVANTDLAMINRLLELWGGSFIVIKDRRPNRAICYHWTLSANQAMKMLVSVEPYLVTKRELAKLCIEFQKRVISRSGYRPLIGLGSHLSDQEISKRGFLFSQVKALNRKDRKWQLIG